MYKNMKKIRRRDEAMFVMAVAYVLDHGVRRIAKLTDEDIAQFEDNGLMTAEYVQALARMGREIATECKNNPIEIIQFCQAEGVFDTEFYVERE